MVQCLMAGIMVGALAIVYGRQRVKMTKGRLLDNLDAVVPVLDTGAVGLLLDLDGTISEIVSDPEAATVAPSIRSALAALCSRLAVVAIITGRSSIYARDVVGLPELTYVGNHGLERLDLGRVTLVEEARPFLPFLKDLISRLRLRFTTEGLYFEDKGGSFAIHYRLAVDPEKACADVLDAITELAGDGAKVVPGKTVINVLPPINVSKGTAVCSLVREFRLSGGILVGDDVTDLDSFRAATHLSCQQGFSSISVAVAGQDSPPELEEEADFSCRDVAEVEKFLGWMVRQTG